MFSGVRLIDLSVAIENDAPGEMAPPKIQYVEHAQGGGDMGAIFGCHPEDLVYSQGEGWAVENLITSSHTGTHVDAPYHYGSTSAGEPAKRIDEVPLEWCFAPGVVIDMRHKQSGELIEVEDLQQALRAIDYKLKPGDIILIHTGASKRWGTGEYFEASTLWLVEQGIHVIGIDAWNSRIWISFQNPSGFMFRACRLRSRAQAPDGVGLWQ